MFGRLGDAGASEVQPAMQFAAGIEEMHAMSSAIHGTFLDACAEALMCESRGIDTGMSLGIPKVK